MTHGAASPFRWRGRWRTAVDTFVFIATALGCAPAASLSPLSNADPEGPEVYFYGEPTAVERPASVPKETTRAPTKRTRPKAEPAAGSTSQKTAGAEGRTKQAEDAREGEGATDAEDAGAKPAANLPSASFEKLPGRYRGTDTLKIRIDGTPEQVQTDDQAKLSVESKEKDRYIFKIVDSQNGSDLCAVTGKPGRDAIEFEPGQTCLEEILGIPTTATLTSGKATLLRDTLRVDLEIALEVDGPNGPQEGRIDYHFEGQKD